MQWKLASSAFALSLVAAACGGDALDPGAGDDPGSGTNTLFVEGRANAEPRVPNSMRDTDFTTEFSVRILLNDVAVTTGTVTVKSRVAETPLTFRVDNMRWEGAAANYDEVYQLDIVSGADEIRGVIVDGPDLHVITAPIAGASLDSTIANMLEWDRAEGADICTFRGEQGDRITIPDSGSYSMGVGVIDAEKDQAKENRLELRRLNHVVPKGAIAGSDFAVSVQQELTVLALPNPAL